MAKVTKVYDVVNVSKMACEDIAAYNFGEFAAPAGGIENGRICERDTAAKTMKYGTAITVGDLWLSATNEKMYETDALTTFITKEGKKVAAKKIVLGDTFVTSALSGTYADVNVDDVLMLEADTGKLVDKDVATPVVEFTVRAKKVFGGLDCLVVERTK